MNEGQLTTARQDQGAKMATKRPQGVSSLIDNVANQLMSLDEAIKELEKVVSPVLDSSQSEQLPEPSNTVVAAGGDRPDSKLRFISDELSRKVNHVRRLSRDINI